MEKKNYVISRRYDGWLPPNAMLPASNTEGSHKHKRARHVRRACSNPNPWKKRQRDKNDARTNSYQSVCGLRRVPVSALQQHLVYARQEPQVAVDLEHRSVFSHEASLNLPGSLHFPTCAKWSVGKKTKTKTTEGGGRREENTPGFVSLLCMHARPCE